MLIALQAEDRNRQLEAEILFIGDVRLMDKIHIADGDCLNSLGSKPCGCR